VWFFEKRRISRLIDKVFDREFNLQRLAEFQQLVQRRLRSKRAAVLTNYQKLFDGRQDRLDEIERLRSMPTEDIVDGWFFLTLPAGQIFTMINVLVDRCLENPFPVLHKLFPDHPRDASDTYYAYALAFLAVLHKRTESTSFRTPWLPVWLNEPDSGFTNIEAAVRILMKRASCKIPDSGICLVAADVFP
jgi:hypothetical protein